MAADLRRAWPALCIETATSWQAPPWDYNPAMHVPTPPDALKRSLNLTLVAFYGIGTILGAGIYVLIGKVAGYAGMYTPFAFLVAAGLAVFSALSYAELASRFPRCAGEAVYVHEAFGSHRLSQVVGLTIIAIGVVSCATLVHGVLGYLQVFFPLPEIITTIALVVVLALIAAWGVNESVTIAGLMTLASMVGLVLVIWAASPNLATLSERWPEMLPGLHGGIWVGILLGAFVAFYAYIGFEDIVNLAEETRTPERTLPRAMVIALLVTTGFYLAVAVAAVLSLPGAELAESDAPLARIYTEQTGHPAVVLGLIGVASILNGALIQIIKGSRVLFGMSRQGWLHPSLYYLSPRRRTPTRAVLVVAGLILAFALALPLLSLAMLTSVITLSLFTLVNFALLRVKRIYGPRASGLDLPRWVPWCGGLLSGGFLLYQLLVAIWLW